MILSPYALHLPTSDLSLEVAGKSGLKGAEGEGRDFSVLYQALVKEPLVQWDNCQ